MAKGNRKEAEEFVLGFMGELTEGGGNRVIYSRLFEAMNDAQFGDFVDKVEQLGSLSIWGSNYNPKEMIHYENLLRISKKYGVEIEQQLIVFDEETGIKSMTPYKAIVGTGELRKQRQMWVKKFSAAKDDHSIDDLTGQVMGDSRSTGISQPEITVLRNLGLTIMANELYNVKGGDLQALRSYKNDLLTTGKTNTNASLQKGDIAKSLKTAHYLLRARGIDNNMNKRYG
jgi:hypothetical protein